MGFVINTMKKQKQPMQIEYTTNAVTVNTKGNAMSLGKFRISLSIEQINWILANCQAEMPELYNQLVLIKFKAEGGVTKPAFTIKPETIRLRKEATIKEKYDLALELINKGQSVPQDLRDAYDEYRYLNDLMAPNEMDEYEKIALGDL